VVVHGPKGEGKSVLARVALAKKIVADRAVVVEATGGADAAKLKQLIDEIRGAGREPILYFDPSQPGHYPQRPWEGARHTPLSIEELALLEVVGAVARDKEVAGVVVLSDDTYTRASDRLGEHAAVEVRSDDILFLQRLVESYGGCAGETAAEVAKEVGRYDGNRALAAALAGDWLKREGCRREAVAEALRRAQGRAVDFALDYIWYAVLGGDRKKANIYAPLIVLRGLYGPIPVKLAEGILIDLGKSSDEVRDSEVVRWFAKRHHETLEEAIKEAALSPVNRWKIEPRELHQALAGGFNELKKRGLIMKIEEIAIDWDRIIDLMRSGLAGDMSQLSDEEKRRCAKRAALVLGHALAWHRRLPRREDLPEERRAVLSEALDPCVVDDYMTVDGTVAPLAILLVASIYGAAGRLYLKGAPAEAASMLRGVADIFSPLASAASMIGLETSKALVDSWRRRGFTLPEAFYALGLAALAAGGEADEETAGLLLYAASAAVQKAAHPEAVLPVLAALRPLGEKAPHRYVVALAAASGLVTLDPETARYIYDALQRHKDRLLETGRNWPLVETVHAYSNLLRKHSRHIKNRRKEAVADMCRLYGEVGKRGAAAALDSGLSAQRLLGAVAGAYVLAAALDSDVLAPLVQRHCGLGDLVKEAEAVRSALETAARPEELRRIMESDADFAEWVTALSVTGDAGLLIEDLRAWLTYELARYKLDHALDEKGELDAGKLEEAAEEFEKVAEIDRKLKDWGDYLTARSRALRARILAAGSWGELLERAEGFWELWGEAEEHLIPTVGYLATAAARLGECLVYLAASGDRERAEDLLKERRWLLDYDREVSVVARLMLRFFGVGEGARLEEVVDTFRPQLSPEFWPALLMLAGRLQRDEALEECDELSNAQLSKAELCVDAVATAAGNRVATKRLRSAMKKVVPETHPLLGKADGKTLVEVLAPRDSWTRLVFMLLAAVEGRADAVRLHGLLGSAGIKEPLPRRLFRAVYENCGDLNSEGCRMALLKLYYLHI
jgi:tetratricopeptide (TPR) repeat protein